VLTALTALITNRYVPLINPHKHYLKEIEEERKSKLTKTNIFVIMFLREMISILEAMNSKEMHKCRLFFYFDCMTKQHFFT